CFWYHSTSPATHCAAVPISPLRVLGSPTTTSLTPYCLITCVSSSSKCRRPRISRVLSGSAIIPASSVIASPTRFCPKSTPRRTATRLSFDSFHHALHILHHRRNFSF